jgi:hypothetical protein
MYNQREKGGIMSFRKAARAVMIQLWDRMGRQKRNDDAA